MEIFKQIAENVEKGDAETVKSQVDKALADNIEPSEILNNGLVTGMSSIGEKFKNNEVYIPEVLIAARAMKAGLEIIKPLLAETKTESKGKIAVGTVKGDLHDIGKNIVCIMLEGAGYDVVDLGIDVPKEKFIETVEKENINVLGLSSLLTTTMTYMNEVIDAFKQAELKDKVKIVIGGAPVTQDYADEVGADGYAPDAASAVDVIKKLLPN
jgi:5-methyltetrahydrofolate--homocysteine methyltransferase